MSILFSKKSGVLIAIPIDRLDTNNSPEAETLITENIDNGETKIIFDLSKTNYISSAGLRVILKAAKMVKQRGGELALYNANELVHEVLEISGFLTLLNFHDNLDEAIQDLSG
jgi:anti-anti-sigma factor